MPIIVLVLSTLALWGIYWFVRMGGIDHGSHARPADQLYAFANRIFMYQHPRIGKDYSQAYAPHIKFYDRARVRRSGCRRLRPTR